MSKMNHNNSIINNLQTFATTTNSHIGYGNYKETFVHHHHIKNKINTIKIKMT